MNRIAEASGGEKKKKSPAIEGIRGLAALALLTVHVAMFSGLFGTKALGPTRPPSNFVGAFFVSGLPSFIGVFFVLPALFLYLPIAKAIIAGERRPPQRNNLVRRLLRLLPAYYAMYAVTLVTLNREAVDGVWDVLRPVLLLQVYLPSPFVPNLMNGMEITWTVPTMVQWYLLLPVIAWAVHRFAARGATPVKRARRLMLPVPILIAIGVGWLFFVKAHGWDNRIVFWWPQGFAPAIGIGMGLAILLALQRVSPEDTPKVLRLAAARPHLFWLGALVVYLVNCARPFSVIGMDAIYSVTGLLVTYLMVALFGLMAALPLITPGARRIQLIDAVLTSGPISYLGRISYGVYLWHFAVMHFYLQPGAILTGDARPIRELYGKSDFVELQLVTIAGTLLIASVSHFLLERPISSWADRRFRDPKLPEALPATAAASSATDPEKAAAAVENAIASRDAIRANLTELENSFGGRLLAGADLTGRSRDRWDAAAADLAALWELFNEYSSVVDQAAQSLNGDGRSGAGPAKVAALLTGPSIVLTVEPPPLAERKVDDDGRTRLTPAAAVERMDRLFHTVALLVAAAETVVKEATNRLDDIRADLAQARRRQDGNGSPATEIAEAEAELRRLTDLLGTDPLALWHDGRFAAPDLDRLRRTTSTLATRSTDAEENSHDSPR